MISDAYGTRKKHNVMQDTWGHLYPEGGSKHRGKILVCQGIDGTTCMIGREFPTLCASPQEYELVCTVLELYDYPAGLYEIECTLWFYKTCTDMYLGSAIGKIIKPSIKTLHCLQDWSVA